MFFMKYKKDEVLCMDIVKSILGYFWYILWNVIVGKFFSVIIDLLILLLTIVAIGSTPEEFRTGNGWVMVGISAALLLVFALFTYFKLVRPTRCDSCFSYFAVKWNGRETIGSEQSFQNEKTTTYVNQTVRKKVDTGTVFGAVETDVDVSVPVTQSRVVEYNQKVYKDKYICRFCGATSYKTCKGSKKRA